MTEVAVEVALRTVNDEAARLVGRIENALREARQIQSDIGLLIKQIENSPCA